MSDYNFVENMMEYIEDQSYDFLDKRVPKFIDDFLCTYFHVENLLNLKPYQIEHLSEHWLKFQSETDISDKDKKFFYGQIEQIIGQLTHIDFFYERMKYVH